MSTVNGLSQSLDWRALLRADPVQLFRTWRRDRRGGAQAVLALLDCLGPALRCGLPLGRAVEVTQLCLDEQTLRGTRQVRRLLAERGARGLPMASAWRQAAVGADAAASEALRVVAEVWALCEAVGAPVAEGVDRGAARVRDRIEHSARVEAATAGARTSVRLVTALPLLSPLLLAGAGLDPVAALTAGPAVIASVVAGLLLSVAGHAWCRLLLRRALDPRARGDHRVSDAAVSDTLHLLALAHRAGRPSADALDVVAAAVTTPAVAARLHLVAAALSWGADEREAWARVGPEWAPASRALTLARVAGAAPSEVLDRAARDCDRDRRTALESAAARVGVRMVLPLGLLMLPAFVLTAVVPMLAALLGQVLAP